jgi:hypothetical protein
LAVAGLLARSGRRRTGRGEPDGGGRRHAARGSGQAIDFDTIILLLGVMIVVANLLLRVFRFGGGTAGFAQDVASHIDDRPMIRGNLVTTSPFMTWGCVILLAVLSLLPTQGKARTSLPGLTIVTAIPAAS